MYKLCRWRRARMGYMQHAFFWTTACERNGMDGVSSIHPRPRLSEGRDGEGRSHPSIPDHILSKRWNQEGPYILIPSPSKKWNGVAPSIPDPILPDCLEVSPHPSIPSLKEGTVQGGKPSSNHRRVSIPTRSMDGCDRVDS